MHVLPANIQGGITFQILILSSARIQISYIPQEKSLQIHLRGCVSVSAAKRVEGVGTEEMEVIDVDMDGGERDIEAEEGKEVVESDSLAT